MSMVWRGRQKVADSLVVKLKIRTYTWYVCIYIPAYYNAVFRFADDIELMTGNRPGLYWLICWKYLSPLAMLSILVASFFEIFFEGSGYSAWVASKGITERQEWPVWALFLIAVLILTSVLWIPTVAICRLISILKSLMIMYFSLNLCILCYDFTKFIRFK